MKIKKEEIGSEDLVKKVKKAKKVKEPRDIRTVFRKALKELKLENIKKPWMAQKSFRLINNSVVLEQWVDSVLNDASRFHTFGDTHCPVVAVDAETSGLDTRILVDLVESRDSSGRTVWTPVYEVKVEISGICLSADGIEGIYIPITHEIGENINRAECTRILQRLFDKCHLIFYNAKFDREVLRLTMGIHMRPYPHFEDVQVLQFINDPKADLGDKKAYGEAGGLKALSKNVLGIEQIELDEIAKVKADYFNPETQKTTQKQQMVPFSWIPVDIALWYAAGDAICTWLLWKCMHELARSRKLTHRVDHELIDSITWIERQRFFIDTERLARTVKGHSKKIGELREKLRNLAVQAGYVEKADDDGNVTDDEKFNPGSTIQLQELLYKIKGFKVTKLTGAGNASCDAEVLDDLFKLYPDDEFLNLLMQYRDYMALHPENLRYDPKDKSARMYLKQNVVAGGRLAGAGGDFERDGGFGLNPQGIKKVEGYLMWKVTGNVLDPDEIPVDQIESFEEADLHPSCFRDIEEEVVVGYKEETWTNEYEDSESTRKVEIREKRKVRKRAPGIINNHIGQYMGYAICLVPKCTSCADKFGVLIPNAKLDANEVINLRVLFCAPPGWTLFSVDYSNIEMRCAANVSGEPEFIKEFLEGAGDFHSLTASKVFPEFNDPNTPKAVRKSYRDLAKIINFALLYGGTEYTIFENMKKKKPDITWQEAKDMVAKYWEGVPVFAQFCQKKQYIAKHEMLCKTATGRVINFKSQMDKDHIHVPSEEETKNYWAYRDLNKKAEQARKSGQEDKAAKFKGAADRMWKDPETGVRNAMDYNKFMGKIQRVSVNVPLQGLAGDFMRMSLNRIRKWVESDPVVNSVFHLHGSVHDEIDFIVKNEYVPFVLPRITRLMKLRKMHEKMNWKVPIEADAEYGHSWDVEHHVTGDVDHKPAAWTEIKEVSKYIPDNWDINTLKNLLTAIGSDEEPRVNKAKEFLRVNLHPRAFEQSKHLFEAKDDKLRKKFMIALLQLDEYWRIDAVPDDEDDKLEKLEQYEQRNNLTVDNRGFIPEFGYLGTIPLDANVIRPKVEILGEAVEAEQLEIKVSETSITVEMNDAPTQVEVATEPTIVEEVPEPPKEALLVQTVVIQQDDNPFLEPVKKVKEVQPVVNEIDDGIPELIDYLDKAAMLRLQIKLGRGNKEVKFKYQGRVITVKNKGTETIPDEFMKQRVRA